MLWAKKNSCKEYDNEKKFLRLENSPSPKNFSNGPSLKRKCKGFLSPGTKKTARGVRKAEFDCTFQPDFRVNNQILTFSFVSIFVSSLPVCFISSSSEVFSRLPSS